MRLVAGCVLYLVDNVVVGLFAVGVLLRVVVRWGLIWLDLVVLIGGFGCFSCRVSGCLCGCDVFLGLL